MTASAVLLAGGKSTRMGRDKAFLEFGGRPLWQHQIETLRQLAPAQLLLSGPARPEWVELELVADEATNAGPLAGIAAALRKCLTSHLVVLAIDLPKMKPEFLRSLLASCGSESGIVPQAAEGFEPLAAVYPASCLQAAEAALRDRRLSLQHFVQDGIDQGWLQARTISAAEYPLFLNLNSPADL